jgi:polysaccharide pyruvyl transferase WcaK-like protein
MSFLRPGSWPKEDAEEYRRFVALWAELVSSCVSRGNRVHLFVSDPEDMTAVRDVWELLGEAARAGSLIAQAENPDELLAFYRRVDAVVSSRLHGVLLAMVAIRPVLGLSHQRKVRTVMTDAGVGGYCCDLRTTSAPEAFALLNELTANRERYETILKTYVTQARASVRAQHEMLSEFVGHGR